ncbi:hypothetical protein OIU79_001710 [Salix purpurea]|uniref:Uncharacterized protein n=1 Tax=Salix purpurea TaxID=77065 RepID=A0A9Q0UQL0_SALPP|nr:hypothetical protein OIU79_001710 [Salix purpurea]
MGKKTRPPLKEKRVAGCSPEQEHLNVEIVDGVTAVKERKLCSHFEKGFDANQLSEKIRSLDSFRVESHLGLFRMWAFSLWRGWITNNCSEPCSSSFQAEPSSFGLPMGKPSTSMVLPM